ncbi:hypothetical protein AJ80_09500 [Polytolypa hystricis UAMH7299]|uniref:Myb-like domain-containing protein n=1 Tax=Polytolypa hystricis (strain UAMH7299) TaxID=1447883 RepID=A0A2B7WH49_POLH7|nr:hypothetical protein AJ80_09500 [Polytolypa hystricis UAMH7299]
MTTTILQPADPSLPVRGIHNRIGLACRPDFSFTPAQSIPTPPQTPPVLPENQAPPSPIFSDVTQRGRAQNSRHGEKQALALPGDDFDRALAEDVDGTVVDLITDLSSGVTRRDSGQDSRIGRCDPTDIPERHENYGRELDDKAAPFPEPCSGSRADTTTLEPLINSRGLSPTGPMEVTPCRPELDGTHSEAGNREQAQTNQDAPTEIEASTSTKDAASTQGESTYSVEGENPPHTLTGVRSTKQDRCKGVTENSSAEQWYPLFKRGQRRRSDAGSIQSKTRPKLMRQVAKSRPRRPPGSIMESVEDTAGSASEFSGDDSDDDYTASSDDEVSVGSSPKRRRLHSLSYSTTTSRPYPRRRRSQVAGAENRHGSQRKPRAMRSVATRECSNLAVPCGTDRTLTQQHLSPEVISVIVSAVTEALLKVGKGEAPAMDRVYAGDKEADLVDTQSSSDRDGEMAREVKVKRPPWTREENERLRDMKTKGWRWWEIEQQSPKRTKAALQQRWSCIQTRGASSPGDAPKQGRKRKWTD